MILENFEKIKFTGTFRDYQQRVLDSSVKFIEDGKIHIVAAPGSGKTILGLELIRRINAPTLILSPTIAIREQWLSRFEENFLTRDLHVEAYCSNSLKDIKLITAITYQGLYSAISQNQESHEQCEEIEDYTSIDLIKVIKENNIKTICLDEAHHLRSEWQKALTYFIHQIEKEVKIIALTATPPYDSGKQEWNRYIDICGEIDEEIFAPELVRKKTLCPHQDYVYLNYPNRDEIEKIQVYYQKVDKFLSIMIEEKKLLGMIVGSDFYIDPKGYAEQLLDKPKLFLALLSFLKANNMTENKTLFKLIGHSTLILPFNKERAEILLQAVLDEVELFNREDCEMIRQQLSAYSLIERNEVCLKSNSKIDRMLIRSIGKLDSVKQIVHSEFENCGDNIRLLILTDYIKAKTDCLGTENEIIEFGVAPIFELLRRENPNLKLAALSGELIIVPNVSLLSLESYANKIGCVFNVKPIDNTKHSQLTFSGVSNQFKIELITHIFNQGSINAIVGTRSLLGEGWDSPVINTLILASVVGSYMLSNQMRGRAIRVDKNDPNKVSNIWHLATIIPEELFYETWQDKLRNRVESKIFKVCDKQSDRPNSYDYDNLVRRFEAFVGLHYQNNSIENSIERITILKPPFTQDRVERMNCQMRLKAKDRNKVAEAWMDSLDKASDEIVIEAENTQPILHRKFGYFNLLALNLFAILNAIFIRTFVVNLVPLGLKGILIGFPIFILFSVCFYFLLKKVILYFSPYRVFKKIAQALLDSLKEMNMVSHRARVNIEQDNHIFYISAGLINGTLYEKNLFFNTFKTFLSPIENPRYVMIKNGIYMDYTTSFAVPDIFGNNEQNAKIFMKHLTHQLGKFKCVYTRSEKGRKILIRCRYSSFISKNYSLMYGKKKLKAKWD